MVSTPKTVLITGANRGIGLALVQVYLQQGWTVLAACREPDAATELQMLQNDGAPIQIMMLDVTSDASAAALASQLQGQPIDLLINNAGTRGQGAYGQGNREQNFGSHDFSVWSDVLAINTIGPLRVIQAVIDNLALAKGMIINISSNGGSLAAIDDRPDNTGALAYKASKAALNMITRVTAEELQGQGVAVISICPGKTRTQDWHDAANYPVTAAMAANDIRQTIDRLSFADTGRFINKAGDSLAW